MPVTMQFWCLCLVCSLSQTLIISAQTWTLMKRYPGWMFRDTGHIIDDDNESTVPDRIICEWRCINTVDCVGVSYNTADKSCLMITAKKIIFRHVQNGNMNTVITIMRPIDVCEIKSSSDLYAYSTVYEAREACNMIGLQLMTYGELDNVRVQLSYSSCRCGYADDGNTYFPMAAMECLSGTIGMNNCSVPLANAYCRSPQ